LWEQIDLLTITFMESFSSLGIQPWSVSVTF